MPGADVPDATGTGLCVERIAGFEQRLESAEHAHPADAGDAFGGLWGILKLVMVHGEQTDTVLGEEVDRRTFLASPRPSV
jgi:hypothetical protein